jgi:hypothetical protein
MPEERKKSSPLALFPPVSKSQKALSLAKALDRVSPERIEFSAIRAPMEARKHTLLIVDDDEDQRFF